ncbi:hypothetical protein MtrunA17_Chr5g0406971 [Medicago truncatula]|uniref:Uncharacterized protein n=1 Tax=Medicago truncatula TaxID=3880 RepID=A0A396HM55_MEDTR|nr:hypothetical protein MtrunA17_Chr5g0406971 [Medicago truncatula]
MLLELFHSVVMESKVGEFCFLAVMLDMNYTLFIETLRECFS